MLAATACGERPEPLGDAPLYPVTVPGGAEEGAVLERRPERVVALDGGAAELVQALGAGSTLVGVPSGLTLVEGSGAARVVRPSGLVDVDALRVLRPDLIVVGASTEVGRSPEAHADTEAVVYVQPDRSLRDVRRAVLELGFLLGEPVRARELAASLDDAAERVDRAVGGRDPVPVFVDTGFFVAPTEDSLLADLVRRAGGRSVRGGGEAETLDACAVLRLGPEVVLRVVGSDAPPPPAAAFAACGIELGRFRFEEVAEDLVTRAGPRAGEALAVIARALHPDARP